MSDPISLITDSLTLPNGIRVPNRLVKVRNAVAQAFFGSNLRHSQAAMAEGIGLGGGPPQPNHLRLYGQWAQGGWGMVISGEFSGAGSESFLIRFKEMSKSILSTLLRRTT